MKKALMNFSLGALLACSLHSQLHAGPKLEQAPTISARTYVYSRVSSSKLAQSQRLAAHLLGRAGIELVWRDCYVMTEAVQSASPSDRFSGRTISDANILLVDRFPEGAKIAGERTLGFAILPEEGGFGNQIYLSLHHIQKYSDEQKAPVELVLGLVIAHEIAHLLGLREHSPTGIMRAYWDKVDLLRAQVGELQFTDQQAGFLRAAILARSKRITDLQAAAVVSRR
jgi:hypothetical protein